MAKPMIGPALTVRITPETMDSINALAAVGDGTRSELVRDLLSDALNERADAVKVARRKMARRRTKA